jgi:hypothetical protein
MQSQGSFALSHVGEQRDVAVGEGGDDVPVLELGQTGARIGPGPQAVPDAVQVVDVLPGEPAQGKALEQVVEDHAVQRVDLRPRQLARAHARHGGPVAGAPAVGERRPVHLELLAAAERLALADDRAAPVDHRAEHVEHEGFHCGGAGAEPIVIG